MKATQRWWGGALLILGLALLIGQATVALVSPPPPSDFVDPQRGPFGTPR